MNDLKWEYVKGDACVVSDRENMIQAVVNRLNTEDELDFLYDNYGCDLKQFLGLPATEVTLEMVKNVIVNALSYDKRLEILNIDLSFVENAKLNILIHCSYNHLWGFEEYNHLH